MTGPKCQKVFTNHRLRFPNKYFDGTTSLIFCRNGPMDNNAPMQCIFKGNYYILFFFSVGFPNCARSAKNVINVDKPPIYFHHSRKPLA